VYFDVDVSAPRAIEAVIDAIQGIPPQRVAVLLNERAAPFAAADDALRLRCTMLSRSSGTTLGQSSSLLQQHELHGDYLRNLRGVVGPHLAIGIQCAAPSVKHTEAARLHRHDMQLVYPSVVAMSKEEVDAAEEGGRLDLGTALAACARSDRADRLFATVVNDECGRSLGLVYSSFESIVEAVRCGRGLLLALQVCLWDAQRDGTFGKMCTLLTLLLLLLFATLLLQGRPLAQGRHERGVAGPARSAPRLRLGRTPLHGQADGDGPCVLPPQHAQLLGEDSGLGALEVRGMFPGARAA